MSNSISVNSIGKCYKIYPSRNARLKEWLLPFVKCHEEKWVLKDVSFEVEQGEAIGIIGMNGAGKSTLLKIITGTVMPTTGSVNFYGTVSALLELGLGFHPDFTGRQNVYMSGQLLGYTEKEITECMIQIEEFAEIEDAIDEPVRTYSSGMQIRLAFSVATMKRPDILIVDEALSVGDAYFQHKSFGRIKDFQKQGTTLLLVSHDKAAIQAVCNRAFLLDKGCIIKQGNPEEIMDYYNALIANNSDEKIVLTERTNGKISTSFGSGDIEIENIKIFANGKLSEVLSVGDMCKIVVCGIAKKDALNVICGVMIKDRFGQNIYGTNTYMYQKSITFVEKGKQIRCSFEFPLNIGVGNYSVAVAFVKTETHVEYYRWMDLAAVFQVVNRYDLPFSGSVYLPANIEIDNE